MLSSFLLNFIKVFCLCEVLQLVHIMVGLPGYDFLYLIIVSFLIAIGEEWTRVRLPFFVIALFLVDISPTFIILPFILFVLKKRDKITSSLLSRQYRKRKLSRKRIIFINKKN